MRTLRIGQYEANIIWRFLDCVSSAVALRMTHGSFVKEENLTFLLCELMDSNVTSLHSLSYPLSQMRTDLESSDLGFTIEVGFETHEHSRYVESKYSGADLGIVFRINHPIFGQSRRGILVQAKRLFGSRNNREYGLYSEYESFKREQADFLGKLRERFGVWNSIFYLWYNPPCTVFPENDQKILRAYDARGGSSFRLRGHMFMEEMYEMGYPWLFGGVRSGGSVEEEAEGRQWRLTQPALRLSDLEIVQKVSEHGKPRLKGLYDATLNDDHRTAFSPFAEFFLFGLISSRFGSDNPEWLRLTEGQRVAIPPPKKKDDRFDLDELDSVPTPRHTLTVTVRGTLPQVG